MKLKMLKKKVFNFFRKFILILSWMELGNMGRILICRKMWRFEAFKTCFEFEENQSGRVEKESYCFIYYFVFFLFFFYFLFFFIFLWENFYS